MCALGVTDKFTVQIEVDAACDTQKRNNILLVRVIDRQLPAINADEVVLFARILIAQRKRLIDTDPREYFSDLLSRRDYRRIIWELIADVHIERLIVASELPACRHVDRVKFHTVRVEDCRKLGRLREELEIPVPVQAYDFLGFIPLLFRRDGTGRVAVRIRDKVGAAMKFVKFDSTKFTIISVVSLEVFFLIIA